MEEKSKTQKEKNPEINSQQKKNSSKSAKKTVTLCSSSSNSNNNNSNNLSFSKLLEGVVMAANSAISSDPLLKNVNFQGQFGISHQEALANVTAKAAQTAEAHLQMQPQADPTKSLIKQLPKEKVEELDGNKGNSCHSNEPTDDVPKTPKSDGYSWRKYGQKQVKNSGSSRSYYRCTTLSCSAKKRVQHLDVSGQVIDVVYEGDHNHDPPQNVKGSCRRKDLTLRALNNCSDSSVQNPDTSRSSVQCLDASHSSIQNLDASRSPTSEKELNQLVPLTHECQDGIAGTSPRDVKNQHTETVDTTLRLENELAIVPAVEEQSGLRSDDANELAMIDPMKVPDLAPLKKRRIKDKGKACSESVYRTFKDPKIVVHADGDVGISSDGYRWRKYGQKMVKGNLHPRSYYRCSSSGCPVRKHVERATEDSTAIIVTYEGKHDHEVPVPKRHHHLTSPNATASGTNTPLGKSDKCASQGSADDQSRGLDNDLRKEKASEATGDKVLESAKTLLSIGIELKSW